MERRNTKTRRSIVAIFMVSRTWFSGTWSRVSRCTPARTRRMRTSDVHALTGTRSVTSPCSSSVLKLASAPCSWRLMWSSTPSRCTGASISEMFSLIKPQGCAQREFGKLTQTRIVGMRIYLRPDACLSKRRPQEQNLVSHLWRTEYLPACKSNYGVTNSPASIQLASRKTF